MNYNGIPNLASILITNYNYGKFLPDCLDSCINQTYRPLEIIIIDDASTDNSREVIEDYKQQDEMFKAVYIEGHPRFYQHGINQAILNSMGEFLTNLDSDDALPEDSIELKVKALKDNSKWEVVCSYLLYTDNKLKPQFIVDNDFSTFNYRNMNWNQPLNVGHTMMWRRRILPKMEIQEGEWRDESYTSDGDLEFGLRMLEITNYHMIPIPLYIRRRHSDRSWYLPKKKKLRPLDRAIAESNQRRKAKGLPLLKGF